MKKRLTWNDLEGWLRLPLSNFSCIERGSGLFVNCSTLEELHVVLMQSPSIRQNADTLKNIEVYQGTGIVTVDQDATQKLSRKIRALRRASKYANVKLYIDKHGGVVIKGTPISLNVSEALNTYNAWIEKNNELSKSAEPTGDEPRGDVGALPGGNELPAAVPGNQSN